MNKENLSKLFQESIDELKEIEKTFNNKAERIMQRFANKILKLNKEVPQDTKVTSDGS